MNVGRPVVPAAGGGFAYEPDVNFVGTDTFTYTVTDGVAVSCPATVTITVQSAGPFDLDGHDAATTAGGWMSEAEESGYGLGVGGGETATILARAHDIPSSISVSSRRILFDPAKVSVNGETQAGYVDLSPTGDVTLTGSDKTARHGVCALAV